MDNISLVYLVIGRHHFGKMASINGINQLESSSGITSQTMIPDVPTYVLLALRGLEHLAVEEIRAKLQVCAPRMMKQ